MGSGGDMLKRQTAGLEKSGSQIIGTSQPCLKCETVSVNIKTF